MYTLIAQILVIISFTGIIFIIFRKIPALVKLPERPEVDLPHQPIFSKFLFRLKEIKYSRWWSMLLVGLEKFLRKFRVLFLKIDNLFIRAIAKSREKSQIWAVRSKAWIEQKRLKKIKKLEILEKLDKDQMIDFIEKSHEEKRQEAEPERLIEKERKRKEKKEEMSVVLLDEELEKILIKKISNNPGDIKSYRELGFLYIKQKNYKDAKDSFRQILKIDPNNKEAEEKLKELDTLLGPEI